MLMNPVAEPNKKICLISFYVCIKTLRKSEQRSGVTKQSRAAGKKLSNIDHCENKGMESYS